MPDKESPKQTQLIPRFNVFIALPENAGIPIEDLQRKYNAMINHRALQNRAIVGGHAGPTGPMHPDTSGGEAKEQG